MNRTRIGSHAGRRPRSAQRRIATFAGIGALVASGLVAITTVGASASGSPDLSIAQVVSGSSQSGHTFDTLVISNHGSASASHVNVEILNTTKSAGLQDFFSSAGHVTCEVMPPPPPYNYGTACQLTDPLAVGHSLSLKGDFSGTAGVAFTTLAEVGDYQGDSNMTNNSSSRSTYFGPAVDLAVGGADKVGTKSGHTTIGIKVVNRGPNDAQHLQVVTEMTNVHGAIASGHGGSCQTVPPANGYDLASSCVLNLLKTGHSYKISYDAVGTSGKVAKAVTTVTSFGKDPNTKNNKITRRSKLK